MKRKAKAITRSSIFCKECGSLLLNNGEDVIVCHYCDCGHDAEEYENNLIVTSSNEKIFNSKLRLRHSKIKQVSRKTESASIKEKCPKCDNEEMNYHTMQLRSADEGQTIFYNCIY
nr:8909_t:CDS:2 [Entrophospora candida]